MTPMEMNKVLSMRLFNWGRERDLGLYHTMPIK